MQLSTRVYRLAWHPRPILRGVFPMPPANAPAFTATAVFVSTITADLTVNSPAIPSEVTRSIIMPLKPGRWFV